MRVGQAEPVAAYFLIYGQELVRRNVLQCLLAFRLASRISTVLILVSAPSPKCTRLSLDDMNPTLMATWLYSTRPDAIVSFTFAPIASRTLLCPTRFSTSQ